MNPVSKFNRVDKLDMTNKTMTKKITDKLKINTTASLIKSRFLPLLISVLFGQSTLANTDVHSSTLHNNKQPIGAIEIFDERAKAFINEKTQIIELASGFAWTEGPLWLEKSQRLIFSDIPNNKIFQYHAKKGLSEYLDKSGSTGLFEGDSIQGSNGLLLMPVSVASSVQENNNAGKLLLLQQGDRRIAVMNSDLSNPTSSFTTLIGEYEGKRLNSPNDGVFDHQGNLFFTDPPYGLTGQMNDSGKELDFQGVYRLTQSGKLTLLDDSVTYPNGIGLSPDNKTLYVAVSDEEAPVWFAYDLYADGSVSKKRLFIDALKHNPNKDKGMPDGMAVHSSGIIFGSGPGGVWLLDAKGKLLAKILTGKLTANCTLSTDEKQLFITSHDSLFKVDLL